MSNRHVPLRENQDEWESAYQCVDSHNRVIGIRDRPILYYQDV